jgi:uncharacterized membrane protein (UPF0136 family)
LGKFLLDASQMERMVKLPTSSTFFIESFIMFVQFTLTFGLVSIFLGVLGYARKKSKASLIAGSISGLLLLLGWYLMQQGQPAGKWVSIGVAVLLLGRFLPNFLKTKSVMPAGIMAILSIVEVVLGLL